MRKINLTLQFEDNDLIEDNVRKLIKTVFGDAVIDVRTLPDTEALYESDNNFKSLCKAKKDLQLQIDRYVNEQKLKK